MSQPQFSPSNIVTTYLGPIFPETTAREKPVKYSASPCPSYVPSACFYNYQSNNPYPWLCLPVEKIVYKPSTDYTFYQRIAEDIENHFELRIQIMALQLLFAQNTHLLFLPSDAALEQYGSPKCQGDSEVGIHGRFACAHSSTLTTLRCTHPQYPEGVVLGKESFLFKLFNITHFLPEDVNKVDTALDRHHLCPSDEPLRHFATRLLNASSIGNLTFKNSLYELLKFNFDRLNHLNSQENKAPEQKFIINCYQRVNFSYGVQLFSDPTFIRRLLFSPMSPLSDEQLCFQVQAEMHECFIAEMKQKHEFSPTSKVANDYRYSVIHRILSGLQVSQPIESTPTIEKYAQICASDWGVQEEVANYIYGLYNDAEFENDIYQLLYAKTLKGRVSIVKIKVGDYLKRSYNKSKINHLSSIVFKVLQKVNEKILTTQRGWT